jgi:hypothetical protein
MPVHHLNRARVAPSRPLRHCVDSVDQRLGLLEPGSLHRVQPGLGGSGIKLKLRFWNSYQSRRDKTRYHPQAYVTLRQIRELQATLQELVVELEKMTEGNKEKSGEVASGSRDM